MTEIQVVCVKYGTKYGADYVNNLYRGVKRNLSLQHSFSCFTENPEGLDQNVNVIHLDNDKWKGWWSKVNIFDGSNYGSGKDEINKIILYIDLDMIISGNIDNLILNYQGKFTTMSTNDIFCEQTQDGYNSSIMLFNAYTNIKTDINLKQLTIAHQTSVQVIFSTLTLYYEQIIKFLMRFDHYLEMCVEDADLVQELCPGEVLDYN